MAPHKDSIEETREEHKLYFKEIELFPLPLILLPNGRQRIRVFESRYIHMISAVSKKGQGFVIAFREGSESFDYGAYVSIIDFGADQNGFLTIDVQCSHLVSITHTRQTEENLWLGEVRSLPDWTRVESRGETERFAAVLKRMMDNDYFSDLYRDAQYEKPDWICARLLEVLPISLKVKKAFLAPHRFEDLLRFLETVVIEKK